MDGKVGMYFASIVQRALGTKTLHLSPPPTEPARREKEEHNVKDEPTNREFANHWSMVVNQMAPESESR